MAINSKDPIVTITKYRYHRKVIGRVTIIHNYQKRGGRFRFKQTILINHNKPRTKLFFSRNME